MNNVRHTNCPKCLGKGYYKLESNCTACNNGLSTCLVCDGKGNIKEEYNCAHSLGPDQSHYYCASTSHHGNNVAQYHK